jgi:beta-glucuronidase
VVTIPNDFNPVVNRSGYNGRVGWYETTFTGPRQPAGRAWDVAFESVRRNATVFLNGVEIGTNTNPYAAFSLRATTLVPGGRNTLIVRVDDFRGAAAFPEDWWNWGGIVGPVSLQPVGRLALHNIGVMPQLGCDYACGLLRVRGTVANTTSGTMPGRVVVRVTAPGGGIVRVTRRLPPLPPGAFAQLAFSVPIGDPRLWSPASPALYSVDIRAESGGRVEQDEPLQVGMRSVTVRGGVLYLNGRRLWLHGAAIHEDMPGQGAALTDADVHTIVGDLKALGANVTRAHYQLSPRLLDALDRAGIMVWAQPPVDHADKKLRTAAGRAQALALLRSTLLADRNHPSVIIDSVGNELSPTPDTTPGTLAYLTRAIRMARALNPGVPVALDTYCYTNYPAQQIYRRLDVLGVSDYFGWYPGTRGHSIASISQLAPFLETAHQRYPNQALVVAEWGAEAFYEGPASTKGTYAFQTNYVQQTYAILDQLPFLSGQIYWTLRDFAVAPGWKGGAVIPPGYVPDGIHHKGLLTYTGVPKPAYAVAQRLFNSPPPYVSAAAGAQARVSGAESPPGVLSAPPS